MSAIIAQSAPPDVTELRTRVSLAAVIAETLPLRRAGRFLVALCPFHGERTPSFTVSPTTSIASAAVPMATCSRG